MARSKKNQDYISFLGESSNQVTGSMYLVKFGNHKLLLECGLYQSSKNDYLDAYKVNSRKFDFDPAEIEFVFVCHAHVDHCGLLPRLVKEGFRGQIITTEETAQILKPLLLNSSYILKSEAYVMSQRFAREYKPIYEDSDVYAAINLVKPFEEYNHLFRLNDEISFQWLENSHCLGAAQLQLVMTDRLKTRKILYTSDIGSLNSCNHFVRDTYVPDFFNDVVIMESTYGSKARGKRKKRKYDNEHLKVAIQTTLERNGSVVLPAFSFSRTQELLMTLYDLFGNDPNFSTEIVVDSMLSVDLCRVYSNILKDDELLEWRKVLEWKNLNLIKKKEASVSNLGKNCSQIVISSSGFCTNGRIIDYLQKHLRDENSMIVFSGYVGDNPSYLAYRIKNAENQKFITLNHQKVKNKASCIAMSSYSSHADHNDLVKYAQMLRTNRIVLVHGEPEAKKELKNAIESAISTNNSTAQVVVSNRKMKIQI